ncbi:MAG: VacJ family lipoprotein, partial [Spirochaetia bacterium]
TKAPYTMVTANRAHITNESYSGVNWDGELTEFLQKSIIAPVNQGGENYNIVTTNRRVSGDMVPGQGFVIGWGSWNFANSVAQLKLQNSAESFMRFNVNTFFGLGGLLDIATEAGIDRHNEDFGQTLGHWGVGAGPYLVIPLLGPSTIRDAAAMPVDRVGDPLMHMTDIATRNSLNVLRLVDLRSNYLRAGQLLDDAALDKYSFTRDAYLQRRFNDVHDGNPPDGGGQ